MLEKLIHEIVPVGLLQCNCSVVGDSATREAIIIDPGDEADTILDLLQRHALTVKAIVVTHAHIDHVGGLKKMRLATGAPVLMNPEDLELYRALDVQAAWAGFLTPEAVEVDGLLRDGDTVRWGNYQVQVIHTPGHSRGSISLYLPADAVAERAEPGRLFAGDTLFAGSIGRTDLWGGSFEQIMRSIRGRLLLLPDDTRVYPGHGPATTISEEREHNPFLRLR